jgi:hypothetical protein
MNEEYLNYIFDKHQIDYVVHGDDPCLLADGTYVLLALCFVSYLLVCVCVCVCVGCVL